MKFFNAAILACLILLALPFGGSAKAQTAPVEPTQDAAPTKAERTPGSLGGDRVSGHLFASRSPVIARHGMAATAHPLATQIALDILKAGGSAVDAAIAANAALGLMEPTGNGIGGDLFAIVYDPETDTVYGLNASGRAPKGLSYEEMTERSGGKIPPFSALAVSVPGAVDGWFMLHDRFGKLPMRDVLAPAIRYAREGSPVPQTIAYYWDRNRIRLERAFEEGMLEEIDNARATYWPTGRAPAEGELFFNDDLADTYELLAEGGRDALYKGEIALTVDAYMRRIGGPLRYADFAEHTSDWVEPLSVTYRGVQVFQLPPNTQGVAALQMLQMLDRFDMAALGFLSAESIHLQVEAKRLAFADRALTYADPAFTGFDPERLIDPAYAAQRSALISPDTLLAATEAGADILRDGDTTYLAVADADGMMVSLIQSNYRGMGSGLVPDGLGFMLQNRGELFAMQPEHPNVYAPGKRPFQTIIPSFAIFPDGRRMAFGLMGGGMQPQGHVQIIVNMVDYGLNIQDAGDAARWRHEGSAEPTGEAEQGVGTLHLEGGFPLATREGLTRLGHMIGPSDGGFGGYQAILYDPEQGVYHGASEMRKDGAAAGY
jgi:gamma-glutamyltranspeptidase/glutathione hydrolase